MSAQSAQGSIIICLSCQRCVTSLLTFQLNPGRIRAPLYWMMPRRTAIATAWVRPLAPSLSMMCVMCTLLRIPEQRDESAHPRAPEAMRKLVVHQERPPFLRSSPSDKGGRMSSAGSISRRRRLARPGRVGVGD